jgi:membrane-associated phospholipid phosphatase
MMLGLKSFYSDPRPYWSSTDVHAWSCSHDFGNPSGHSLIAMSFGIQYLHSLNVEFKNRNWLIGGVTLAVLIGFARLVLGAHSINQILYGWQIGIWIALMFIAWKPQILIWQQS